LRAPFWTVSACQSLGIGQAYLEEEPNDKHLQGTHTDDKADLDHAKVDDPALGAVDGGKVAVFTGSEVLLVARDGGELARHLEDSLLQDRGLFWGGSLLRGQLGAGLVLDGNLKVDILLGKGAHLVVKAERVVTNHVGREDKVALPLLLAVHDDLAIGTLNNVVDIERTSRLDL
jgi:hypothetical protein